MNELKRIDDQLQRMGKYQLTTEEKNMGTVIAVGPGKKISGGRREDMPVQVGARVRFGTMNDDKGEEYLKYFPYYEDGVKYLVMSWQDICFEEPQNA